MKIRHVVNVRCGNCNTLFELGQEGVVSIPVPGYPVVLNFGVVCPKGCWTHSFYTTSLMQDQAERISKMEDAEAKLRARLTYQKTFEKFQVEMTARLEQDRANANAEPASQV